MKTSSLLVCVGIGALAYLTRNYVIVGITGNLQAVLPYVNESLFWIMQILIALCGAVIIAGVFGYGAGRVLQENPTPIGLLVGAFVVVPEIWRFPGLLQWAESAGIPISALGQTAIVVEWVFLMIAAVFFARLGRNHGLAG